MSGNDFKALRQKLGLSQSAFALKFHIPVANVQHWEQGYRVPPSYVFWLIENDVYRDIELAKIKELMYAMADDVIIRELVDACKGQDFCFDVQEVRKIKGRGPCAFGTVISGMAFEGSRVYRNSINGDTLNLDILSIEPSQTRKDTGWVFAGDKVVLKLPYPNAANVVAGDKLYQLSHFLKK